MTLMDLIMEEMHSRMAYLADDYTPHYVCSYAVHVFNLLNQRKQIYWEAKRLPNMRLHLMFISPSGYMKSYYMENLGGDPNCGIFAGVKTQVGYEQSMSEAGFIGTVKMVDDMQFKTEGAAEAFQNGILMIDEFSAITNAYKSNYNNQMDSQMLAALDHGNINKRLGSGKIEYKTSLTLWGGVQPARYDFTSGMGRRMWFMLFQPTPTDNNNLMDIMMQTKNMRIDRDHMQFIWRSIDQWVDSLEIIESISFDPSVIQLYKKLKLYSYETSLFDRLLLGYHLATHEAEPHMVIRGDDPELMRIIGQEKSWRMSIVKGLPFVQIYNLIKDSGSISTGEFTISRNDLVSSATMVGWNAGQVNEVLIEMVKYGMLKVKGNIISMEMMI